MFKCQQCGEQSKPGEKSFQKPVEFRPAIYPYRSRANRGVEGTDDPGGKGLQVKKELRVCGRCV